MIDTLKGIFVMSLFYAVVSTMIVHALPEQTIASHYLIFPVENVTAASEQMEQTVTLERGIPIVNLGVMVFYSGNIFIDLLVNFVTAIPSMLGLLLTLFLQVFHPEEQISTLIQTFYWTGTSTLYILSLLSALLSIRTGRVME